MDPLKPALKYDEQLARLKNEHALTITNDDAAYDILKKVNYYRLSGYGIGLTRNDDKEKYLENITIDHIYQLYEFDRNLRNIFFRVIEQLEIQLRTQISYHLALKYGPEGYIDNANFNDINRSGGISVHESVLNNFRKECIHQKNNAFVKHHVDRYENHFPIWVAVELFTFGNLSSLYCIMKPEDSKEIAKLYKTEPRYLGSWILALVELRNICAHYGRLYNRPLKQAPHLYREHKMYRSNDRNKLFPVLLVIKRMLNCDGEDERWLEFLEQLETLLKRYRSVVRLSYIGFPTQWQEVLRSPNK